MKVPKATQADRDQKPTRSPVPEGDYSIFIDSVTVEGDNWKLKLVIQDEGPQHDRWLFDTITWTSDWRWKQIQILEALGFDMDSDADVTPDNNPKTGIISKSAKVTVVHNTKGDKTYANVRGWESDEDCPF